MACLVPSIVAGCRRTHVLMMLSSVVLLFVIFTPFSMLHGKEEVDFHRASFQNDYFPKVGVREEAKSVAYAISVTGCTLNSNILQGAAILSYSIHKQSRASLRYKNYTLYAFVVAEENKVDPFCHVLLKRMGYQVLIRENPIPSTAIQNNEFRKLVDSLGCCGADEFLKLYSYTLLEHSVVVHLDTDAWLLQPLDDLFDVMTLHGKEQREARQRLEIQPHNNTIESTKRNPLLQVNALLTLDYAQVHWHHRFDPPDLMPTQGGFFVVRPSRQAFQELKQIVVKGNYTADGGWANLSHGDYWGGPTIQGLYTYYYYHVHPHTAIELHHCIYNNVVDNPYYKGNKKRCTTSEPECTNCETFDPSRVKVVHPLFCFKAWKCRDWNSKKRKNMERSSSCKTFLHSWFSLRQQVEEMWVAQRKRWTPTNATGRGDYTLGYCDRNEKYIPMNFTYLSLMAQ